MKKSALAKPVRAVGLVGLLLVLPLPFSMQGCTDLKETPLSSITPENYYHNEAEVLSGMTSVYAQLRSTLDDYYNVSEISTDEMVVPTRGSDWYDNGQWLDLHRQTWTPNSPAAGSLINGSWNALFTGVARANTVLDAMNRVTIADQKVVTAELRTLRAFYYYGLMDLFGGVPIVTDVDVKPRARNTRAEVFNFIESELNAARADLPASWPAAQNGRMTKGAADAILASMYVNARVYLGTVTPAGLQPGTAKWTEASAAADRILNSGQYSLAANWRSNFTASNATSPENIFVVKFLNANDMGLNFVMRVLHYNQYTPSPWNGFATLAETYNSFDPADQRRQIFLVGPQVNQDNGLPVTDRAGNPLNFTVAINDVTQAKENEGARILKWPVDPNHVAQNNGNDFAWFRLAEIMLIKAEALNELGQAGSLAILNSLRARVGAPQYTGTFTQAQMRDMIFKERLLELTAEGKRRQDMIRAGIYTNAFSFKTQQPAYKVLMPIPLTQMQTNPLLTQNPGY
ncbi:MAG TPA: RagB/SusD family nutrient uptake outer membrane protein [Gemmatimonadaceae bacterium]|nr:RagB/SusD family nutrient uptake outer membrane protein [Gemmatimonadaceae bacterium]